MVLINFPLHLSPGAARALGKGQEAAAHSHQGARSLPGCVCYYLVGVPVTVKYDHSVSRLEVQTQAPGPGAEQEDEVLGAGLVESFQQHPPVLRFRGSCRVGRPGLAGRPREETQMDTCIRERQPRPPPSNQWLRTLN